jgi:predicted RNA-binding Zn ribbon-like protein
MVSFIKIMAENTKQSPWSFQAGNLALDFANTVDWHASDHPDELLHSYQDVVDWARDYAVLSPESATALASEADRHPEAAGKALVDAITLRETIYRIFSAIACCGQPEGDDLERLKEAWRQAVASSEITPLDEGYAWKWESQPSDLEQMLWPVAQAAVDLLLSDNLEHVGQCADDRGCGMLFIDTSRNRSRQWCSMDACGNRAKAKRHYQRTKQEK